MKRTARRGQSRPQRRPLLWRRASALGPYCERDRPCTRLVFAALRPGLRHVDLNHAQRFEGELKAGDVATQFHVCGHTVDGAAGGEVFGFGIQRKFGSTRSSTTSWVITDSCAWRSGLIVVNTPGRTDRARWRRRCCWPSPRPAGLAGPRCRASLLAARSTYPRRAWRKRRSRVRGTSRRVRAISLRMEFITGADRYLERGGWQCRNTANSQPASIPFSINGPFSASKQFPRLAKNRRFERRNGHNWSPQIARRNARPRVG